MPDEARCALRKEVVELLELLDEKSTEFWEVLADEMKRRDLLCAQAEEVLECTEFTDAKGEEYGRQIVGYGQYATIAWRAVPDDYVDWLADAKNLDAKNLNLYAKWRAKRRRG